MSDTDNTEGAGNPATNGDNQAQAGQGGSFRIATQYVKDLSFESPNAPQSLGTGLPQPAIDVMVDVFPAKLGKEQYEVAIQFTAKAKRGDNVVFIVELVYAGLFTVTGIPQDQLQALLLLEAPRYLFPFARRILSDVTSDGGFPALAIDYMDFERIYRQRLAERAQQRQDDAGAPALSEDAE